MNARRKTGQFFKAPTRPEDIGYLAGIFDGEGSLTHHHFGHWTAIIYQSDVRMIEWLLRFGGYSGIRHACRANLHAKGIVTTRDMHYWAISKRVCMIEFLTSAIPLLIVKKDRAEQALKEIQLSLSK